MSIKIPAVCKRLTTVLIAGTIIGCGSSESNSGGAPDPAGGAAVAEGSGGYSAAPSGAASRGVAGGFEAGAPRDDGSSQLTAAEPGTVLFIGTSLTAGAGLPKEQSFPLLIGQLIREAGLPFRVVNAGVSGETSAGALSRIDWLLRQPFDAVVLETGANDMLRGVDPAATRRNLQAIIDELRAARPDVPIVLAGMLAAPNLGEAYRREFEAIYPELAERNELPLVPFLLEDVAGVRRLNQSDGVHPTAEGQRIVAETVWEVLEPVLVELEEESRRESASG